MILVGMPDSPYVRRVAVSLKLMGIAFEHRQRREALRLAGLANTAFEVPVARYPALVAYSHRAERLPELAATPLD